MSYKFGYARVSTLKKDQDASLEAQIAKLKSIGCDEVFYDRVSGILDHRTQFNVMMTKLRRGDTVCVTRLDRLGRRMISLINFINDFKKREINFVCTEHNIDTSSPMGQLMFNMLAAFAEMEHQLTSERVKAAMARAKAEGKLGGRLKATPEKVQMMVTLKDANALSVVDICKQLGISRNTFYIHYNEAKARQLNIY